MKNLGNGLPRQSADWLGMTGCPRLRRGTGDADCHASDIGHWLGMTPLRGVWADRVMCGKKK